MTGLELLLFALAGKKFLAPGSVVAPSPSAPAPAPSLATPRAVFDYRPKKRKRRPDAAAPAPRAPAVLAPAPRAPAVAVKRKRAKKRAQNPLKEWRKAVVKIPGNFWIPLEPLDSVATAQAAALRDEIWATGEGSTRVLPMSDGRILGFLAIGEDHGMSVWRLRPGTAVPEGAFPPMGTVVLPEEPEEPEEPLEAPEMVPLEPEESEALAQIEEHHEAEEGEPPAEIVVTPEEPETMVDLPTLMQGSTGEDVVTLQKALGITGTLGTFGPMTAERVRNVQKAHGLEQDGIVGPETWKAIFAP